MNITFLIGNGFDLNLGLNTSYSDFVEYYKDTYTWYDHLRAFREHINENEKLWSAAELALGQYTNQFDTGNASVFSDCQTDFCDYLVDFLKTQESKIDYEKEKEQIIRAFGKMNSIIDVFPTVERNTIKETYITHLDEGIRFNFICFNYTNTLDKCLEIVKNKQNALGSHKKGNQIYSHSIGELIHVHGTVDKDMVFGVNDETQIAKLDIFDCEDGDLYKDLLIKQQANKSYAENTDDKASTLINNSHLIYVYGMSIGETDKLWWSRLVQWINKNENHHLIIQSYDMPQKAVVPTRHMKAIREKKRELIKHGQFSKERADLIADRIHVTNENIFSDIANILSKKEPIVIDLTNHNPLTV